MVGMVNKNIHVYTHSSFNACMLHIHFVGYQSVFQTANPGGEVVEWGV